MKKLVASVTAVVTFTAAGPFAIGFANADEGVSGGAAAPSVDQVPPIGTPGRGYALGGAHVMGIPYDEYIRRTGADWFPGLNREIVDYPAGQVQGHVLGFIPGIS